MLALNGNVLVAFTGPPASKSVSDGGGGEGKKENPKHTGCRRLKPHFCSLGSDRTQTQGSSADGQGGKRLCRKRRRSEEGSEGKR